MTPEQRQTLQQQTDIIEAKILQVAGELVISTLPSASVQDSLGEAISALIKVKLTLGLHTNLTEVEG